MRRRVDSPMIHPFQSFLSLLRADISTIKLHLSTPCSLFISIFRNKSRVEIRLNVKKNRSWVCSKEIKRGRRVELDKE